MYNKKYIVASVEEFGRHNPIYENIEDRVCYPAYLNVGERGWLLCETNDYSGAYPHRWHTSIIKNVEYTEDSIILTTENTKIIFVCC